MTYDVEALRSELVDDEGLRLKPYLCPAGFYSIGIGHNLDANGIPAHVVEVLFYHDVAQAEIDLNRLDPNWREHPDEVQRAMVNLVFNLGASGWAKFKNTRAALILKDYESAARCLAKSKWAKQVQKSRSERIIRQIREAANA